MWCVLALLRVPGDGDSAGLADNRIRGSGDSGASKPLGNADAQRTLIRVKQVRGRAKPEAPETSQHACCTAASGVAEPVVTGPLVSRALQKLEGAGAGSGVVTGARAQVAQLLADAQDPDRLSRMYIGWLPFV